MTETTERLSFAMRALIAAGAVVALLIFGPLLVICAIEGWHAIVYVWSHP